MEEGVPELDAEVAGFRQNKGKGILGEEKALSDRDKIFK